MRGGKRWLKTAFLAGMVTDALALAPLLSPRLAAVLWGVADCAGFCRFAMGYAASLMAGWTLLLAWAYRKPVERRFVAPLTMVVIGGLVLAEIVAVARGDLALGRMVPTWVLQAVLLAWFGTGYRWSGHDDEPTTA